MITPKALMKGRYASLKQCSIREKYLQEMALP